LECRAANTKEIFDDLVKEVSRFRGATYERLKEKPLQWPIFEDGSDSPVLHLEKFSTEDGKGYFHYHKYEIREQIKNLIESKNRFLALEYPQLFSFKYMFIFFNSSSVKGLFKI
jgi:predicted molibdopterin-dependent oxidoreductase YjgC